MGRWRWGAGVLRLWKKYGLRCVSNAVGSTKWGTFLTRCQNPCRVRLRQIYKIFGWLKTEKKRRKPLPYLLKNMKKKYAVATLCLEKDRDELQAFYNFLAEHWKHIRTTNPIESTFATSPSNQAF
ncbi:MAG: transposase [Alphaproteobacteria bacterium]|nr:transposase [Alphaproteobacteria bacterium]